MWKWGTVAFQAQSQLTSPGKKIGIFSPAQLTTLLMYMRYFAETHCFAASDPCKPHSTYIYPSSVLFFSFPLAYRHNSCVYLECKQTGKPFFKKWALIAIQHITLLVLM